MLLVVDIGNTNVVMAVDDGSSWLANWRIHSDQKKTSDEYFVIVERMVSHGGFASGDLDRAVISSVVPNLTRSFQKVVRELIGVEPLTVTHDTAVGLNRASIPSELGHDLLANAVAAHRMYPDETCVVLDFGTALTFTTVSSEGNVLGAAIAPGLVTAVNSLFLSTAQIPQVQLRLPERAIGRNSDESIRSGIMYGYAGLVKELVRKDRGRARNKGTVIATGAFPDYRPPDRTHRPYRALHTLEGLRIMADARS